MKWFFALNESHAFENFSKMVQVAVHTAQKYTSLVPHFIYDGKDNFLTDWLAAKNVSIIRRRSFIYNELNRLAEKKGNENILNIGSGAFLRTEIPQLCHELNFTDDFVLYTDVDVMFCGEVVDLLEEKSPKYFAVAPEFERNDYKKMNSGVMLMNIKNLQANDADFRKFILQNLEKLVADAWDQTAFRLYYRGKLFGYSWDKLEPELNWKTYWGNYESAKIIHFHGAKPFYRKSFAGENTPAELKPLLPLLTKEYDELCDVWEKYYSEVVSEN
jgi:hypothetical protein